jgi:predicted transcriptional regulator
VAIGIKLPVDLLRHLDEVAESSFRTRPSQIAYYIAQGLKSEGREG